MVKAAQESSYEGPSLTLCGVDAQVLLIAVHPWDCHGALKAGLQAAHISRASGGARWPTALFKPPEVVGDSLLDVVTTIMKYTKMMRSPA